MCGFLEVVVQLRKLGNVIEKSPETLVDLRKLFVTRDGESSGMGCIDLQGCSSIGHFNAESLIGGRMPLPIFFT
jgi:hypothetical protein